MEKILEEFLRKNDQHFIQMLRLFHLIKGVNESIAISQEMNSAFMQKQYEHLKKEYTTELLELLAVYRLPLQLI